MHVGLICNEYPPAPHGGNGSLYSDLAEGLASAGHRATVVGIYPGDVFESLHPQNAPRKNLRIVRLKASPSFLRHRPRMLWERCRLLLWLKQAHSRAHFDLIEAPDYEGWLCFGGLRGVPTVIRMGGSNLFFDTELRRAGDAFEHNLEVRSVRYATHLAAVSRYCATRTLGIAKFSNRPCNVIHNAVDTEVFCPNEKLQPEPGLIVFVNSVAPKKGIEQLVQAMNIVCENEPHAHLVVIGQDTQLRTKAGSYVERVQAQIKSVFRDRIVFTGQLPRHEVIPYLQKAAVCCYPSQMETFGIAPVEAMSVGRPTIYSRTGPGPEVIEDGMSGLLCDPFDSKDIADRILFLFRHPDKAAQLGIEARKRVQMLFDKKNWIRRNLEFFQDCVKAVGAVKH